jgi:uncharacterized membrane protein
VQEQSAAAIEPGSSNDRILALSDGVFAFAMTLLVLGLKVPDRSEVPPSALPRQVLSQWPGFLTWVISFLVIGTFWMAHHRQFKQLRSHDNRLVWLNLLLLLCVAFLPFPTALIGQYSDTQFAVIFYACSMLITSLSLMLIGLYAARSKLLVVGAVSGQSVRAGLVRGLTVEAICLLSIALSFVSLTAATLSWALIPVAHRFAEVFFHLHD